MPFPKHIVCFWLKYQRPTRKRRAFSLHIHFLPLIPQKPLLRLQKQPFKPFFTHSLFGLSIFRKTIKPKHIIKMIRIIAVEDEPIYSDAIEIIIEELGYDLVGITDNSEEMLRFFASLKPDLALMDIHINGSMTGIEVAKKVANSDFAVPIIFITSYMDKHIFESAKETNPYAYIVKPIDPILLKHTIELALSRYSKPNHIEDGQNWKSDILIRDHLFIKTETNQLQKVALKNILIIEVIEKICHITTKDKVFTVRMPLKEIEDHLPISDFVQINRNTIINAFFIDNIDLQDNILTIRKNHYDISRRHKENLLSRLNMLK